MSREPLQTLILRRLASTRNRVVAEALGVDDTTVSRISSGERGIPLDKLEKFLGALGIAGVEVGGRHVTISAEKYQALLVLAREALNSREEF
jgi:transcriptional regulator with XRE-family HTH domain